MSTCRYCVCTKWLVNRSKCVSRLSAAPWAPVPLAAAPSFSSWWTEDPQTPDSCGSAGTLQKTRQHHQDRNGYMCTVTRLKSAHIRTTQKNLWNLSSRTDFLPCEEKTVWRSAEFQAETATASMFFWSSVQLCFSPLSYYTCQSFCSWAAHMQTNSDTDYLATMTSLRRLDILVIKWAVWSDPHRASQFVYGAVNLQADQSDHC